MDVDNQRTHLATVQLGKEQHEWKGIQYTRDGDSLLFKPTAEQMENFQKLAENIFSHEEVKKKGCCKMSRPPHITATVDSFENFHGVNTNMNYSRRQSITEVDRVYKSLETPITLVRDDEGKRRRKKNSERKLKFADCGGEEESDVSFDCFLNMVRQQSNDDFDETEFWSNLKMKYDNCVYATGDGSLFKDTEKLGNLRSLKTILDRAKIHDGDCLGIRTPFVYIGTAGSHAGWHVEDSFLPSVNFLHAGKQKKWTCIPNTHRQEFEELSAKYFPEEAKNCNKFLRHKTSLIPPAVLSEEGIPFTTILQNGGEYVLIDCAVYHQVINTGINIAEAVNFGTNGWANQWLYEVMNSNFRQKFGL